MATCCTPKALQLPTATAHASINNPHHAERADTTLHLVYDTGKSWSCCSPVLHENDQRQQAPVSSKIRPHQSTPLTTIMADRKICILMYGNIFTSKNTNFEDILLISRTYAKLSQQGCRSYETSLAREVCFVGWQHAVWNPDRTVSDEHSTLVRPGAATQLGRFCVSPNFMKTPI